MPRMKQPLSMKKLALQTVAQHIEMIAYGPGAKDAKSLRQINETETYLTFSGPFPFWPSEMLHEMLATVAERRSLTRIVLHLLVQPHLLSFNLACGAGDVYYAVRFLQERCQNLQQLDLSYISFLGPDLLCRLVRNLPHVKSLNLQMTPVTDQVLGQIGLSCRELRHLDVSSAPVSDRGLVALCHLADDGSSPTAHLNRLAVLDTQITPKGVAYVMRFSPQLRQIDFENLFKVFDHLSELRDLSQKEKALNELNASYQLTSLKCSAALELTDDVESVVFLCPHLQTVSVVTGFFLDADALLPLKDLAHLSELSLSNGPGLGLDFTASVLPILEACGAALKSLILTRFDYVHLAAIGSHCSQLRNLALAEMGHIATIDDATDPGDFFSRLQALEVWAADGVQLPPAVIKQLLKSCSSIRNVFLRGCDAVDDALFAQLWKVNPMTSLTQWTLDNCRNVTATTIISILNRNDDLHVLRLWSCHQLDGDDYELLKTMVSSGNMDVDIDWYCYNEWT